MKQVRVRVDLYFGLLFSDVFWKKIVYSLKQLSWKKYIQLRETYLQNKRKNIKSWKKYIQLRETYLQNKRKNIKFNTYTLEIHTYIFWIMHPKHISLFIIQNKDISIFLDPKMYWMEGNWFEAKKKVLFVECTPIIWSKV